MPQETQSEEPNPQSATATTTTTGTATTTPIRRQAEQKRARKLSDITVSADSPLAYLIIRDRFNQVVGAGLGSVNLKIPPGAYLAEVRMPGCQEEHYVAVPPGSGHKEVLPAPEPQSAIAGFFEKEEVTDPATPTPRKNLLVRFASAFQYSRYQLSAGTSGDRGKLLVTLWAPHGDTLPTEDVMGVKLLEASGTEILGRSISRSELNYLIFGWPLEAGVYHLQYTVPGTSESGNDSSRQQRRAQTVLVESGWTTDVHIRVTVRDGVRGNSAAIFMSEVADSANNFWVSLGTETEIALDALYVDGIGVPPQELKALDRGKIEEPVRAMCVGYARLKQCIADSDSLIFPRYILPWQTRKRATSARRVLEKHTAALRATARLGDALAKLLPHSVDAQLIAVAARWELEALERAASGVFTRQGREFVHSLLQSGWLRRMSENRKTRLMIVTVRWILVAVASLALFTMALYTLGQEAREGKTDIPLPDSGNPMADWILYAVPLAIVALLLLWYWLWIYKRESKIASAYFSEVPMLAPGMDILLRLAALYEDICAADGHVTDIALRLTADSIWTRWDADTTPEQARAAFAASLRNLEEELLRENPAGVVSVAERSPLVTQAAEHLAVALQLPLAFIRALVGKLDGRVLPSLLKTSPEKLEGHFKEKEIRRDLGDAGKLLRNPTFWFLALPLAMLTFPYSLIVLGVAAVFWAIKSVIRLILPGRRALDGVAATVILAFIFMVFWPVFAQAREKARAVSCLSNTRQVATALMMYVQDHDERFPLARFKSPNPRAADSKVGTEAKKYTFASQVLGPYIKNIAPSTTGPASSGIWTCPSQEEGWIDVDPAPAKRPELARFQSMGGQNSYAWNALVFERARPLTQAAIEMPATTIGLTDGTYYLALPRYPRLPGGKPDDARSAYWKNLGNSKADYLDRAAEDAVSRHKDSVNVLFLDGHAKAMLGRKVANLDNTEADARAWNP